MIEKQGVFMNTPCFCFLRTADTTTGDFSPGVAGWLRVKIVGAAVDDDSSPKYIRYTKTVGQHSQICCPAAREQGRQVACVLWMGDFSAVKVPACIGKVGSTAISPFVDVQGKKAGLAVWQTGYLRNDQNAFALLIELNFSGQTFAFMPATDTGNGVGGTSVHFISPHAHPMQRQEGR